MNWILMFDVLAWLWGVIFTTAWIVVVSGSALEKFKWGEVRNLSGSKRAFWIYSFLASICWAWVIVG